MIGIWSIEPEGSGTRYTASARHWTEEAMRQHQEMGFIQGWSPARTSWRACAKPLAKGRCLAQQLVSLHHLLQLGLMTAVTAIAIRVIAVDQIGIA
jgi:hypothetical protein